MEKIISKEKIETILEPFRKFSPFELAEHLNIKVLFVKHDDKDFSGAIRKHENEIKIYINLNQSENRKLFTLAHELGHFFLHNNKVEKGIVSYRHASFYSKYSFEERKIEEEANHFAAEMLMPKRIFTKIALDYKDLERENLIKKLSEKFEVSRSAVKIRLNYLDIDDRKF